MISLENFVLALRPIEGLGFNRDSGDAFLAPARYVTLLFPVRAHRRTDPAGHPGSRYPRAHAVRTLLDALGA